MNIDDRPIDLTLWKILHGHNFASGHPISYLYVRPLYVALVHYTSLLIWEIGDLFRPMV